VIRLRSLISSGSVRSRLDIGKAGRNIETDESSVTPDKGTFAAWSAMDDETLMLRHILDRLHDLQESVSSLKDHQRTFSATATTIVKSIRL